MRSRRGRTRPLSCPVERFGLGRSAQIPFRSGAGRPIIRPCEWNVWSSKPGTNTLTLDLHPRLTVVAGHGSRRAGEPDRRAHRRPRRQPPRRPPRARGAQRPAPRRVPAHRRPAPDRRRRPGRGRHRRVHRRRRAAATCSPASGLDSASARRTMRFGAADLATSSNRGQAVEVLAALDQRRVWAAAEALRRAEGDLTTEAEAIGSAPEDAAMIDEVEARHIAVEHAVDRFETDAQAHLLDRWRLRRSPPSPASMLGRRRRAAVRRHRRRQRRWPRSLARARVGRAARRRGAGARRGRRAAATSASSSSASTACSPTTPAARRSWTSPAPAASPSPSGSSSPVTSRSSGRSPTARRSRRPPAAPRGRRPRRALDHRARRRRRRSPATSPTCS